MGNGNTKSLTRPEEGCATIRPRHTNRADPVKLDAPCSACDIYSSSPTFRSHRDKAGRPGLLSSPRQSRSQFSASLKRSLKAGRHSRKSVLHYSGDEVSVRSEGFPSAPADGSLRHSPTVVFSSSSDTLGPKLGRETSPNDEHRGGLASALTNSGGGGIIVERSPATTQCHGSAGSSVASSSTITSEEELTTCPGGGMVRAFQDKRNRGHKREEESELADDQGAAATHRSGVETPKKQIGLGHNRSNSRNSAVWRERVRRNRSRSICEGRKRVGNGAPAKGRPSSMVKCWEGRLGERGRDEEERAGVHSSHTVKGRPACCAESVLSSSAERVVENCKVSSPGTITRRTSNGKVSGSQAARNSQGKTLRDEGRDTPSRADKNDDDDRSVLSLSPLRTSGTYQHRDCDESLSASSAGGSAAVQEQLSVSSLPPMGTAATATAAEWMLEELSLEDSGASGSIASSADRHATDGGDTVKGGNNESSESNGGGGVGRKRGEPLASRQRQGSASNALVRTRSAGRGLTSLMARIREQEERDGSGIASNGTTFFDRESGQPDLSDFDDGASSPVFTAPAASSTTSASWTAPISTPSINVSGHQRAALELRNLTLEREVEQLKAHLRSMGGRKVVGDRQRNTVSRRPRPRPHHLKERSLAVGAVGGAAHSTGGPAGRARAATTATAGAVASTTRRSSAPPMSIVSESPSTSFGPRENSGIGGDGGSDVVLSSAQSAKGDGRGRSKSVDMVRHQHDSNRRRLSGTREGNCAETTAEHTERTSPHQAAQQKKTPSPPRLKDHRLSGPHTSAAMVSGNLSSPMRRLRNVRLRSPESASETCGERPEDAWLQSGTSGMSETFQSEGGRAGVTRGETSDDVGGRYGLDASIVDIKHDVDDRGDAEEMRTTHETRALKGTVESRPLPRLRAEEPRRRRGASEKARAGITSIGLGGVVSGMKHSLIGRRRSSGGLRVQVVAPSSSKDDGVGTSIPSSGRSSGRTNNSGRAHPRAPLDHADRKSGVTLPAAGHHDNTVGVEASTECEEDSKKHTLSSQVIATTIPRNGDTTTTKILASNERRHRRGGAGGKPGDEQHSLHQRGGNILAPTGSSSSSSRSSSTSVSNSNSAIAIHRGSTARSEAPKIQSPALQDSPRQTEAVTSCPTLPTSPAPTTTPLSAELVGKEDFTREVTLASPTTTEGGEQAVVEDGGPRLLPGHRWPEILDARWAEVEFVLCRAVESEKSLKYTAEATEDGLVFMDKLEKKAQELGVLKGQLSRWLLPYNADTSVDEQQAATPRRFQEALQKSIAAASTAEGGLLTEEEAEYLTAGARKVRQLIRLKIADDNDLNTAKEALVTMASFFASITEEASRRGGSATAFTILQERRARSPIGRPLPLPNVPSPHPDASKTSASTAAAADGSATTVGGKSPIGSTSITDSSRSFFPSTTPPPPTPFKPNINGRTPVDGGCYADSPESREQIISSTGTATTIEEVAKSTATPAVGKDRDPSAERSSTMIAAACVKSSRKDSRGQRAAAAGSSAARALVPTNKSSLSDVRGQGSNFPGEMVTPTAQERRPNPRLRGTPVLADTSGAVTDKRAEVVSSCASAVASPRAGGAIADAGGGLAPPGSLERLKLRRRQQTRSTRSNSQR